MKVYIPIFTMFFWTHENELNTVINTKLVNEDKCKLSTNKLTHQSNIHEFLGLPVSLSLYEYQLT